MCHMVSDVKNVFVQFHWLAVKNSPKNVFFSLKKVFSIIPFGFPIGRNGSQKMLKNCNYSFYSKKMFRKECGIRASRDLQMNCGSHQGGLIQSRAFI